MFLCQGTPGGSIHSGSGLKASQKTGPLLQSHPTDWERPGIEPAIPGLQDRFIPYTMIVLAVPVLAGWVYACCGLLKAQPAVVLVLKRLRRRGNGLKVSNGAKIRNRYIQVPHLTQDTNGKVTN